MPSCSRGKKPSDSESREFSLNKGTHCTRKELLRSYGWRPFLSITEKITKQRIEVCFTLIFWDVSYIKLPKNVEVNFSLMDWLQSNGEVAQDSVNCHQRDDTLEHWYVQWVAPCQQGLGGGSHSVACGGLAVAGELVARDYGSVFLPLPLPSGRESCQLLHIQARTETSFEAPFPYSLTESLVWPHWSCVRRWVGIVIWRERGLRYWDPTSLSLPRVGWLTWVWLFTWTKRTDH